MRTTDLRRTTVQIAREIANYPRNVSAEWDGSGYVVRVNNPVSPVEFTVRHYANAKTHETGRVQVKVPRDGVSNGTVVRTARRHGLEVMDIWQLERDTEASMGQEGHSVLQFGLERIDQAE